MTDAEWEFVAPHLTLMVANAPQRAHDLREVFDGMRYMVRGGQAWRMMPNDLPPWSAVYQQAQQRVGRPGVRQPGVHGREAGGNGFAMLPRRWVVERSFAWLVRFRWLTRDYERLASTLWNMQLAAVAIVMPAGLANWTESA